MKKKQLVLLLLPLFLVSCGDRLSPGRRFQLWNFLNIEQAVFNVSGGTITVRSGLFDAQIFRSRDNSYIEMPRLPHGFFLHYRDSDSFPTLRHVRGFENNPDWPGSIFEVEKIYFYHDTFIVEAGQLLYKISSDYTDRVRVDYVDDNFVKKWVFYPMQPCEPFWVPIGSGLFLFLNGDQILIRGVYQFEIGLFPEYRGYNIWGKSVYGFFDINVKTLEISFPVDMTQYNDRIHFTNNRVSRNYEGMRNTIREGRTRIEIFREIERRNVN